MVGGFFSPRNLLALFMSDFFRNTSRQDHLAGLCHKSACPAAIADDLAGQNEQINDTVIREQKAAALDAAERMPNAVAIQSDNVSSSMGYASACLRLDGCLLDQ